MDMISINISLRTVTANTKTVQTMMTIRKENPKKSELV